MSIRTRCSLGLLMAFAVILSGCNNSDRGEQSGAQSDDPLSTQVAYSGRPLYLFRGDTAPGDTLGHGIENLWQVLLPSGELLNERNEGALGDTSSTEDEDYNPDDNY